MTQAKTLSPKQVQFLDRPLLRAPDFEIERSRPYIIKKLLLASQVSMLAGPPNIGKSSVLACIAAHVSLGKSVGGLRTKRTAVLYVAAEDPHGIAERAYGFWQNTNSELAEFHIFESPVNLSDDNEMATFRAETMRFRREVTSEQLLIVYDTLNLCIGEGDENSARDMSRVVSNARALTQQTGAHVMIVHHTGTSDRSRPRGSSAMHGNVDTLLMLERADGDTGGSFVRMIQEKQRSMPKGKPVFFEISPYAVGKDEDGEVITVPIARPIVPTPALLASGSDAYGAPKATDARTTGILRVIEALNSKNRGRVFAPTDIYDHVIGMFEGQKTDTMQKAVRRVLASLANDGTLEVAEGGQYRLRESTPPAAHHQAA